MESRTGIQAFANAAREDVPAKNLEDLEQCAS
jgi:hypothetical protein